MSKIPPHERPTAAELRDGGAKPMSIAGRPADVCPYCGIGMFATGTRQGDAVTFRYVECRNENCRDESGNRRRFYSRQQKPVIVREIGDEDVDADVLQYGA